MHFEYDVGDLNYIRKPKPKYGLIISKLSPSLIEDELSMQVTVWITDLLVNLLFKLTI